MEKSSYTENLEFGEEKVKVSLILETEFSKEIRIAFLEGQEMKEHKAKFPIIVHLLEGEIVFGVEGEKHQLKTGDILTLAADVPHDLLALKKSIVRLTLSKQDSVSRVNKVVEN